MSLEWSRIVPEPNKVDQEALDHYRKMIEELVKRNITPFITLHHFTEPIWWMKEGSLLSKKSNHLLNFLLKRLSKNFLILFLCGIL